MTPAQRQLYDYIDQYWDQHGFAPSYEQMAKGVGLKSKSGIHRLVHAMAAAGHVEVRDGRYRTVRCLSANPSEFQTGYAAGYRDAVEAMKAEAA